MLHMYDFQVWLSVAAFFAFLVLKFWKCSKIWPSISKWTYTCQKNLKIQVRKYSAFDLAFLTFVGLFKILLRSLRCKKSGGMQESCTLAFYHQKQFSLKISHFESVCLVPFYWFVLLNYVQKQVFLDVRREAVFHQARLGSRLLLEMAKEAAEAPLLV